MTLNPTFPSPWKIVNNEIQSQGKYVRCAGWCTLGEANFPTSSQQATSRAKKVKASGARVYRFHHTNDFLYKNFNSHAPRLQWMLNVLKKQGIPAFMECWSWGPDDWREDYKRFFSLDLSNVVALSPVNEKVLPESEWNERVGLIRKLGYAGLIFGSNSMKMGGVQGDLADIHLYADEEGQKEGEFFWMDFDFQTWNYPKPQTIPVVATEIGAKWPNPERNKAELQIIEKLLAIGTQVIIPFAMIEHPEDWTKPGPIRDWIICSDPERMETWRNLVHQMNGLPYFPRTYTEGFNAVPVDGKKWKVSPTLSVENTG